MTGLLRSGRCDSAGQVDHAGIERLDDVIVRGDLQRRRTSLRAGRGVAGTAGRGVDRAVRDAHTSERFFTSAVESRWYHRGRVYGPESITVPLINDSRDAEKPDSAKTAVNVWPGRASGSCAVVLGAAPL